MAFTVVHVKWQQWFSKGQFQEQCIWVSFGSNSARVNQKCKRCSKHILLAMLRDEQRLQEIFLNATWGKFSWRLQAIRLSIQNTLMPFFDHEGAVPPCQMVNHHYCWGILQHLRDTILQKHLKLYSNEEWLIHHDTAPVHTAFFRTANFGCRKSGCRPPHPLYSPHLAPHEFVSFPRMQLHLWGCCFQDAPEFHQKSLTILSATPECQFKGADSNDQ